MAEAAPLPDSAGTHSVDLELEGGDDNGSCNHDLTTNGVDPKLPDSSSSEGDLSNVRKLQKNDSGIDVEKSPSASTRDGLSSDADCGDSVSECFADSTGFSLSHSESVKSEDSHSRPDDDVEASFSDNNLDSTDVSPNETSTAADFHVQDSMNMETDGVSSSVNGAEGGTQHVDDDEDDDNDDDAVADSASAKRKRRHEALLSSSDTDSDDEEEGAAMETGDKSEEEEPDVRSEKPWPKHKWRAITDLRNREIGLTNCTPPSFFREKVQGSLQMVQRLKLQYKMEYHDGCVNALHFNRIGKCLMLIVLWQWLPH